MAPEPQAYALARYSRSSDPIEESLRWVNAHSSEKFWERFYFDYGHASIADLGHVALCFENVSELAALEILDEQSWDGQAKSTRYQDFASSGFVVPQEVSGSPDLTELYSRTARKLIEAYTGVHQQTLKALQERLPRPDDMKEADYERNLAARAFDMSRYLLPLATPTSLGQVVSIRTLEKQIARLLVSDHAEVRQLAKDIQAACSGPPDGTWLEMRNQPPETAPLAPTLARHCRPNEFLRSFRQLSRSLADRYLKNLQATGGPDVHLIRPHSPEAELASTILYSGSNLPYAKILGKIESSTVEERQWIISEALGDRGPHDELPRETRAGQRFLFDISMDIGGWRDLHRHRRCDQTLQTPDLLAGPQFPEEAASLGVIPSLEGAYAEALEAARHVAEEAGPQAAQYLLPFAHRVRCLFKMDLAEVDYLCRLRSGTKGHPSYRKVAWEMAEAMKIAEPTLASLIEATPPWVEDPLKR